MEYPDLPVFDRDLGNKDAWRMENEDSVLMTSAPEEKNKTYWIGEANKYGFIPKLLAIIPPRMVCYARMKDRDGQSPSQRNDLEKSIEYWFKHYTRHPAETRVHTS